jgi:hypothetical protein
MERLHNERVYNKKNKKIKKTAQVSQQNPRRTCVVILAVAAAVAALAAARARRPDPLDQRRGPDRGHRDIVEDDDLAVKRRVGQRRPCAGPRARERVPARGERAHAAPKLKADHVPVRIDDVGRSVPGAHGNVPATADTAWGMGGGRKKEEKKKL